MFYHTKLYGFDFVGVNLETAIHDGDCPADDRQVSLSSPPASLPILHQIGVTMVDVANNHSKDC